MSTPDTDAHGTQVLAFLLSFTLAAGLLPLRLQAQASYSDPAGDGIDCRSGEPSGAALPPGADMVLVGIAEDGDYYVFTLVFAGEHAADEELAGGVEFYDPSLPEPDPDPNWFFNTTGNVSFNVIWSDGELFISKAEVAPSGQWQQVDPGGFTARMTDEVTLEVWVPKQAVSEEARWMATSTNFFAVSSEDDLVCDEHGVKDGRADLPLEALAGADVYVEKFGFPSDTVAVGDTLTYRILVGNAGPNTATGIVVRDVLPASVEILAHDVSPGPKATGVTCEQDGQEVSCTIASLEVTGPEEQVLITVEVIPQQAGTLENTATVEESSPGDPVPENNQSEVETVAQEKGADLSVSIEGPDTAEAGTVATYGIKIKNLGPDPAREVVVFIHVDPRTPFWNLFWIGENISCTPSEEMPESEATCETSELESGEQQEITVQTAIGANLGGLSSLLEASVSGDGNDPDGTNNNARITINVTQPTSSGADLEVVKTVDKDVVNPGDTLIYTITVTNNGPEVAEDVVVTDWPTTLGIAKIDATNITASRGSCEQETRRSYTGRAFFECEDFNLAPGEQATIQIPMEATTDEMDIIFSIFNQAGARSATPDPDDENNRSEDVEVISRGPLEVTKAAPSGAAVGNAFTYTISVTNHGPVEAPDVRVIDEIPFAEGESGPFRLFRYRSGDAACELTQTTAVDATVSCELGTLGAGETDKVSFEVLVIEGNRIAAVNTATALSADGREDVSNAVETRLENLDVIVFSHRMTYFAAGETGGGSKRAVLAAVPVDIYLDSTRVVNDLAPGEVAPFEPFTLRRTTVRMDVVDAAASDNSAPLISREVDLLAGEGATLHLSEQTAFYVVGTEAGEITALVPRTDARRQAENPAGVDVFVAHAAAEVPAVAVRVLDDTGDHNVVETLTDSLAFGEASAYVALDPLVHNVAVAHAETGEQIEVFRLDLTEHEGEALALVLAGDAEDGLTLSTVDSSGARADGAIVTAAEPSEGIPDRFVLHGNYPNPFNPQTTLRFDLPWPAEVRLEVFDLLGRRVMTVAPRVFEAGASRTLQLDASSLPSGLYVYRLTAETATDTQVATGRMALIK